MSEELFKSRDTAKCAQGFHLSAASDLVLRGRNLRQLTQKELARISDVPASTLSRIEAGVVEPAYKTVVKLMRTMGLKPDAELTGESTDEQIENAILSEVDLPERYDIYRVAAQVSPVTQRIGARTVTVKLSQMIKLLEETSTPYAVSALEGFYGRWDGENPISFWPVVYVAPDFTQPWPTQPVPLTRDTVYVMPLTERVARYTDRVGETNFMPPDWSIIDTIASPNRQADIGLEVLAGYIEEQERKRPGS